jgi:hypothetical protein
MSTLNFKVGRIAFLAGIVALSGCTHFPAPNFTGTTTHNAVVANGRGILTLQPQVRAGGFRTQAAVTPYTKASIQHLVLKVFALVGTSEVQVTDGFGNPISADLLNSELDNPITFSNLMVDTTYRIRCYAYKAQGENASDLISTNDAQSYVDVNVANDDRPVMANLKVKLIDVAFNGEADSSFVEVTEGGFVNNSPVTIKKGSQVTPNYPATLQIYGTEGISWSNVDIFSKIDGVIPNLIILEDSMGNILREFPVSSSYSDSLYSIYPKGENYPVYLRAALDLGPAYPEIKKGPIQSVSYISIPGIPAFIYNSANFVEFYSLDIHTLINGVVPQGVEVYVKMTDGFITGIHTGLVISSSSNNFILADLALLSSGHMYELAARSFGYDRNGYKVNGADQLTTGYYLY